MGAGTGTIAFGWKGGIGTSSRVVRQQNESWTVGVLVQTNFGGRLTIAGVPVWRELTPSGPSTSLGAGGATADGSCMIVVATDAPLDARDLKRLAARAVFALARTGSTYSNGSGDFAIAFSTTATNRVTATNGPQPRTFLPTDAVSGLFEAVARRDRRSRLQLAAQGHRHDGESAGRSQALPIDRLKDLLKKYGR